VVVIQSALAGSGEQSALKGSDAASEPVQEPVANGALAAYV
jgi:hypothetical protein